MTRKIKKSAPQLADRFRILFEYSPIAIWEEDFTALSQLKESLKKLKVTDIQEYLRTHPDVVKRTFRQLRIVDVNKAGLALYGATSKKELLDNLGKTFHKDAILIIADEFAALLSGEMIYETEFKSRTLSGKLYDVKLRVAVPEIYKKSFKRVIVTLQDISVQKKYERHLKRLAQTDGLTKMLNHSAIRYRLEEEFRRAERYRLDLSCLLVDLDNFKMVNDRYGHPRGDLVLKRTALVLKKHLRELDIIGRYGGDEFLLILPETPPDKAHMVAARLNHFFAQPETIKYLTYPVSLAIGISGRPDPHVKTAKDIILMADRSMYSSKKIRK